MKPEERIESRLDRLSGYLRQTDSLVPAVLERLDGEEPAPRAKVASARIRFRVAVVAAALVLFAVVASWMRPSALGPSLAYAEVQDALRRIESAIIDSETSGQPHENHRTYFRRDKNVIRKEYPNGITVVYDFQQGREFILNEKDRTAQFTSAQTFPEDSSAEYLDHIASLTHDAVEQIGTRQAGDRELTGFLVEPDEAAKRRNVRDTIWVDPETRLPVLREYVHLETELRKGSRFQERYTFNRPLAPELLQLTPPAGYRLVSSDEPRIGRPPQPEPPAEGLPPGPTLKPGVGIGEARFGMTAEEVVASLGKADRIGYLRSYTPEERRLIDEAHREAKRLDEAEGQRLIREVEERVSVAVQKREPDTMRLEYDTLGLELDVSLDEGFTAGFCWSERRNNYPYTGTTPEGIGIGATEEEIRAAYGWPENGLSRALHTITKIAVKLAASEQPDCERIWQSAGAFRYDSLGLDFMLSDGKVWYIVFRRADEGE